MNWALLLLITGSVAIETLGQSFRFMPVGEWPGYVRRSPHKVAVSGDFAYLALAQGGLEIVNITNATNPLRVGHFESGETPSDLAPLSNFVYSTIGSNGLQVIDVTNPTRPVLRRQYPMPGQAYGIEISGNYGYVAAGNAGLQVLDLRDPANP